MTTPGVPAEAIERLRKILATEARRGYDNRAVAGGLAAFVPHWLKASAGAGGLADEIGALLARYGDAAQRDRPHRLERLDRLLADLQAGPEPARPPAVPAHPPPPAAASSELPGGLLAREGATPVPAAPAARATPPVSRQQPTAGTTSVGEVAPAHAPEPLAVAPRSASAPAAGPAKPARAGRGQPLTLDAPVSRLTGIKGASASKLAKLGVSTIRELLFLFPNRHIDYSDLRPIRELPVGETATVLATVFAVDLPRTSLRGKSYIRVTLADHTGTALATFFNQRHIADQLVPGLKVYVSGKVGLFEGRPAFSSPEWEPVAEAEGGSVHTARIVPVYPLTADLKQRWLRARMAEVVPVWAGELADHLPAALREAEGFPRLGEAVLAMHFPRDMRELAVARERLAFDELLLIQLGVLQRRARSRRVVGIAVPTPPGVLDAFEASLPFRFTGAQRRAIGEILHDMAGGPPMTRLLQGDVGSGKTVVAAAAAVVAAQHGLQTALMAPTEILAEQHYRSLTRIFGEPADDAPLLAVAAEHPGPSLRLGLLTGSTARARRAQTLAGVAAGEVDLLIGTHALIQESVEFADLGLAVVDEQHRFGVEQRASFRSKGRQPHLLVMTATPIPRTLALTLYGDLDSSIIDELPPGRQPVRTRAVGPDKRRLAYDFVRKRIAAGDQVFVICPLVEESEKIEAKAATAEFERLRTEVFPELADRMGLLHGRMPPREKDAEMARFRAGEHVILVSTAVVEVGVDVPNATVMLIEGADRFGLAQLHQFRGRVGRGEKASYCILVSDSSSAEAAARLAAMERTQNGFELAEADLALRGPGEFFGTRQSGLPDLKVASLGDALLLQRARAASERLLAADPDLARPEHAALAERVAAFWRGAPQAG